MRYILLVLIPLCLFMWVIAIAIGEAFFRLTVRRGWRGWSFENMPLEEDEDV